MNVLEESWMLLTYYLITPRSRVLLEKLTCFLQLVKKFPSIYGTRMFITTFTSAQHLPLSWTSSIQSTPPHPTSWRSIIILSSHLHLGLRSGLFPSGFPTKTLHSPLLSPIRATCISFFSILSPERAWTVLHLFVINIWSQKFCCCMSISEYVRHVFWEILAKIRYRTESHVPTLER